MFWYSQNTEENRSKTLVEFVYIEGQQEHAWRRVKIPESALRIVHLYGSDLSAFR